MTEGSIMLPQDEYKRLISKVEMFDEMVEVLRLSERRISYWRNESIAGRTDDEPTDEWLSELLLIQSILTKLDALEGK